MDFGIICFATDTAIDPQDLAPALEARGFESLFYAEHTHIPTSRRSPFVGGGELPAMYWHSHDPFIALSFAAACTKRLKLGTGVKDLQQAKNEMMEKYFSKDKEAADLREYAKTPRTLDDIPLTDLSADDRRSLLQHAVLLTYIDGEQATAERNMLRELADKLRMPARVATRNLIIIDQAAGKPRVLMGRRHGGHNFMPGKWVFPGGYVDRGEPLVDAAIREAREECGLDVRLDALVNVYSYADKSPVVAIYAATAIGGTLSTDEEGLDVRAVPAADIPWDELAFRSTREALQDYLAGHVHPRLR